MSGSLAEQTMQWFLGRLLDAIPGVDKHVERARADPTSFAEVPWINIERGEEETRRHGESADDNDLLVDVEIAVRADQTIPVWETKADMIAIKAHALLVDDEAKPPFIARIRKTGSIPMRDEADGTAGKLTLRYTVRFLTSAEDIEVVPNRP